MNNPLLSVLFLVMTILGAFGGFFLKRSTGGGLSMQKLIRNVNFYLGGGAYFLSAVLNVLLLRYLPYIIVLPLTSVTYIWSMILAGVFLKEKITREKIAGLTLICVGVFLLVVPVF